MAAKREHWRNWQYWLRPERLVFVDETGAKTNMARPRGRSLKGQRLKAAARMREQLWKAVADIIDQFSHQECMNFIRHAGCDRNQS